MQTIKFKGESIPEYKGIDGKGGLLCLKAGDVCEVTDSIAAQLLRSYGRDFEVTVIAKPEHSSKFDKQLKKTAKFKSK